MNELTKTNSELIAEKEELQKNVGGNVAKLGVNAVAAFEGQTNEKIKELNEKIT